MKKYLLPNNQYIEIRLGVEENILIEIVDKITNNSKLLGVWDTLEKRWSPLWNKDELFILCKRYPQLKRMIHKAQNHKDITPVILQWKCFLMY